MKDNPKSYTLWGHRQWVILEALQIEKFMSYQKLKEFGGGILNSEIMLCDKMLVADERNFHCWNYRSWVINTQLEQYDQVEQAQKDKIELKKQQENGQKDNEEGDSKKDAEGDKETQPDHGVVFDAGENKMKRLKSELDMTKRMIEKNFSNFSAWHYRSNLLLKIHKDSGSPHKVPLKVIEEELESIKHAIFTEPNDQSPWNYHRWLVSLLIPIYIVSIDSNEGKVQVKFSSVVNNMEDLELTINGKPVEYANVEDRSWLV